MGRASRCSFTMEDHFSRAGWQARCWRRCRTPTPGPPWNASGWPRQICRARQQCRCARASYGLAPDDIHRRVLARWRQPAHRARRGGRREQGDKQLRVESPIFRTGIRRFVPNITSIFRFWLSALDSRLFNFGAIDSGPWPKKKSRAPKVRGLKSQCRSERAILLCFFGNLVFPPHRAIALRATRTRSAHRSCVACARPQADGKPVAGLFVA